MNWFKFYGQDFLTDMKMSQLSVVERLMWVTILCLAHSEGKDGNISYCTENLLKAKMGLQEEDQEWQDLNGFFDIFEKLQMIERTETGIFVINFSRRQNMNFTPAEKQLRYREKQRKVTTVTEPKVTTVTSNRIDKTREEEIRIEEENTSSKKVNSLNLSRGQIMVFLKEFPGLATQDVKDQETKCSQYMSASSESYKNPGLFFRGWLRKYYSEWKKEKAAKDRDREFNAKHQPISPEQFEENRARIAELKEKYPMKTI